MGTNSISSSGIETAFGVELGDHDTADWVTLGDIADWLERRFDGRQSGEKCASAMAFYRLRGAVGDRRLAPGTRLVDCLPDEPKKELKKLSITTALLLPRAKEGLLGSIGGWFIVTAALSILGLPLWILIGLPLWMGVGLSVPGIVLNRLDRGVCPVETLGQLAGAAAHLNHGRFATSGARQDRDTIWRSLVRLAELHAGASPEALGRQTRIIT